MKRVAIVLTAVLVVLMSGTVLCAQETTESRAVTYKTVGDKELKIHLHFPPDWKTRDRRPAIVFFFGGGWNSGTVDQFLIQAEYFAARGLVAARADYRIKSRDGVTPDKCVEDARSAVRWMRKNSRRLGIDPKKLIASGGSAGGHLAACMMIADSVEADGDDLSISTIPQAMVLFNPVLSFENERMLTRLGDNKQLARKISPTSHLDKKSPPALILFGTNDRLKVFGDDYWKKAEEIGVRADKYLAEGQPHGFFNRSPWRERTLIVADKFLASLGYLRGEPTVEVPKAAASPPRQTSADRPDRQNRGQADVMTRSLRMRLDKNDDGKISSDEAQGQLKKNFDRVDTNGDGLIDRGELENLAERLQRNRAGSALKGEIVTLPDKISSQAKSLDSSFVMYTQTKVVDGKKAPLIIFLHGGGGSRRKIKDFLWNNQAKAVNQKDYPFNVLIPHSKGQWKPKDLDLLLEHVVKEYNIDKKRIYLTGHSMGGAGTWRWASTRPKTFAAIAPLAGGGRNREEGIVDLPLEGLKNTPIWTFQGDKDTVTPAEYTQEIVEKLKKMGSPIILTIMEGKGHGIGSVHNDTKLYDWFLKQSLD